MSRVKYTDSKQISQPTSFFKT